MSASGAASALNQAPFRLLALPEEVCCAIYRYALLSSGPTTIPDRARNRAQKPTWLALLTTCRQMRTQVSPVFFGMALFHFHGRIWEQRFPPHMNACIQNVCVKFTLYSSSFENQTLDAFWAFLRTMGGLKKVHFVFLARGHTVQYLRLFCQRILNEAPKRLPDGCEVISGL